QLARGGGVSLRRHRAIPRSPGRDTRCGTLGRHRGTVGRPRRDSLLGHCRCEVIGDEDSFSGTHCCTPSSLELSGTCLELEDRGRPTKETPDQKSLGSGWPSLALPRRLKVCGLMK